MIKLLTRNTTFCTIRCKNIPPSSSQPFSSTFNFPLSPPTSNLYDFSPPVKAANFSTPVIALESTIVSHGMPYPQNLETAKSVESIITSSGCVPATIAVLNGRVKVGLTSAELTSLAKSGEDGRATKVTTRELGYILSSTLGGSGLWGSTTVASTMYLANKANVEFFVTGGTGGVHRDYSDSLDCSADLTELGRTNVTVFSAGVKSILDVPRTLEYLETQGVTVGVFGSDEFPAFFSTNSGCKAPITFESYEEVARAIVNNRRLGLKGGFLLTCPNPKPLEGVDEAVEVTVREVKERNVLGKEVTPYILKRVAELTGGESLESNIALVENNARIGAGVARAVKEVEREGMGGEKVFVEFREEEVEEEEEEEEEEEGGKFSNGGSKGDGSTPPIIVMGGAVVDMVAKPSQNLLISTSNKGVMSESYGGVARNVVETIGRLLPPSLLPNVSFYSAVGADSRGSMVVEHLDGVYRNKVSMINFIADKKTATYLAVMNEGNDLHTAVADMGVLEDIPVPAREELRRAEYFVFDANVRTGALKKALGRVGPETMVIFEPTSYAKAFDVARNGLLKRVNVMTPNEAEVLEMGKALGYEGDDAREVAKELLGDMSEGAAMILITMGEEGVVAITQDGEREFPVKSATAVVNSTAAGDSFLGGFITNLYARNGQHTKSDTFRGERKDSTETLNEAIIYGMRVAAETVAHDGGVKRDYGSLQFHERWM